MKAKDFEFDGRNLSDFGFILCNFGSKGLETLSNGANITFNTVSTLSGKKFETASTQYEDCLSAIFQICKASCNSDIEEISDSEFRELTKWLSRHKFLKFKILDEGHIDLYYEVKFDISRIEIDGCLYGLELEALSNRPFALKEKRKIIIENTEPNGKHSINDTSHEEGYIYPTVEIVVNESGDLSIYNAIEDRTTLIKNCVAGEVITMDYPIILSSISSHNVQNDFNYIFFRIANSYNNSRNDLTISLPCTIKATYSPIVKVGL